MPAYSCMVCGAPEDYRAINNIPKHAHYCRDCYKVLSQSEKEALVPIIGGVSQCLNLQHT